MSLEWFSRLKEYDSLLKTRTGHLNAIKEQEDRVSALNGRKEERMAQLSKLKEDYVRLQQELQDLEARIKLLTKQRENWISLGGDDKKLTEMGSEISKLEDSGLELLDRQGLNSEERNDAQTFIDGISKTIAEIHGEAETEKTSHQKAISQLDQRLDGILEMLPEEFKTALMRALKKNLAHGPFTRIENGSCIFCRYKISRVEESEIDMQKKLKNCPQCGRIFIPYGT